MNDKNPLQKSSMTRRVLKALAFVIVLVAVIFALGPRNRFGPETPAPREAPPNDLAQLDDWLARKEAAYPDLIPEAAKRITWLSPEKKRTPWAVVYLHGFSASRLETHPVADMIAKGLGANRYDARLAGHGRGGPAMAEATPQEWLADTAEAIRIGRLIGDKVLVLGVSTGATLATWAATHPKDYPVDAFAFVSPNYAPRDPRAGITNWPWGKQIVLAMLGPTRSWTPSNPAMLRIWTTSYPTQSVFPMMALVKHVGAMDLTPFTAPVLMLYSETDEVISPDALRAAFARIGSSNKTLEAVTYSQDKNQHVLAGDLTSPVSTAPLTERIIKWVKGLEAQGK